MTDLNINKTVNEKARVWLGPEFDEKTRNEVRKMIDHNPGELIEAFYKDLEFGTGGLRGIMGAGTNRMNIYTLGMATQGLSNYIIREYGDAPVKVAVAHDCRNNSRYYAETTAAVFSAGMLEIGRRR